MPLHQHESCIKDLSRNAYFPHVSVQDSHICEMQMYTTYKRMVEMNSASNFYTYSCTIVLDTPAALRSNWKCMQKLIFLRLGLNAEIPPVMPTDSVIWKLCKRGPLVCHCCEPFFYNSLYNPPFTRKSCDISSPLWSKWRFNKVWSYWFGVGPDWSLSSFSALDSRKASPCSQIS